MVHIFITYDLKELPKGIHLNVKNTMISDFGYSDKSPSKGYQLPNTCLIKDNITPAKAAEDLKNAVNKHKGHLERYFTGVYENWSFWSE